MFSCGSLSDKFISTVLGSLPSEFNNKKVTIECVDKPAVAAGDDAPITTIDETGNVIEAPRIVLTVFHRDFFRLVPNF